MFASVAQGSGPGVEPSQRGAATPHCFRDQTERLLVSQRNGANAILCASSRAADPVVLACARGNPERVLLAIALERPHVHPMDFTGRSMTGMVYVAPDGVRGRALRTWVEKAAAFAYTLPPKHPRASPIG